MADLSDQDEEKQPQRRDRKRSGIRDRYLDYRQKVENLNFHAFGVPGEMDRKTRNRMGAYKLQISEMCASHEKAEAEGDDPATDMNKLLDELVSYLRKRKYTFFPLVFLSEAQGSGDYYKWVLLVFDSWYRLQVPGAGYRKYDPCANLIPLDLNLFEEELQWDIRHKQTDFFRQLQAIDVAAGEQDENHDDELLSPPRAEDVEAPADGGDDLVDLAAAREGQAAADAAADALDDDMLSQYAEPEGQEDVGPVTPPAGQDAEDDLVLRLSDPEDLVEASESLGESKQPKDSRNRPGSPPRLVDVSAIRATWGPTLSKPVSETQLMDREAGLLANRENVDQSLLATQAVGDRLTVEGAQAEPRVIRQEPDGGVEVAGVSLNDEDIGPDNDWEKEKESDLKRNTQAATLASLWRGLRKPTAASRKRAKQAQKKPPSPADPYADYSFRPQLQFIIESMVRAVRNYGTLRQKRDNLATFIDELLSLLRKRHKTGDMSEYADEFINIWRGFAAQLRADDHRSDDARTLENVLQAMERDSVAEIDGLFYPAHSAVDYILTQTGSVLRSGWMERTSLLELVRTLLRILRATVPIENKLVLRIKELKSPSITPAVLKATQDNIAAIFSQNDKFALRPVTLGAPINAQGEPGAQVSTGGAKKRSREVSAKKTYTRTSRREGKRRRKGRVDEH